MQFQNAFMLTFWFLPIHNFTIFALTIWTLWESPVVMGFVGAGLKPAPTESRKPPNDVTDIGKIGNPIPHGIPEFIRALKTFSSRRINESGKFSDRFKWQRNYWEHIIRDNRELFVIRQYIINNPSNWKKDKLHSADGLSVHEEIPVYGEPEWMI